MQAMPSDTGVERDHRLRGLADWRWPTTIVLVLLAANAWWLHAYRRWGLLDLDEAGYVATADRIGRARNLSQLSAALRQGYHGPLQGLLSAPVEWLVGSTASTLFWQSTILLAITAVASFAMGRRLAGVGAGTLCALVVVCADGLLDYSRTALTVMPATALAAASMSALLASRGLRRTGWCVAFGAAAGAMVIGRSMAIAYLPALALGAAGWAYAGRTEWRTAVRNGALAIVAALAVGGWWWVARGSAVLDYLSGPGLGGGSSGEDQVTSPPVRILTQAALVLWFTGTVSLVMVAGWGLMRWRDRARDPHPHPAGYPALWPLWAAIAMGILALSPSSVSGTGFGFPFIPWLVVAVVAGAQRSLSDGRWRKWALVVGAVASISAVNHTVLGRGANQAWCRTAPPVKELQGWRDRWVCDLDPAESRRWQHSIDQVADRLRQVETDLQQENRAARISFVTRDWLVNANTIDSAGQLRHGWSAGDSTADLPSATESSTIGPELQSSDIIVAVPDRQPVELYANTLDPNLAISYATTHGFTGCTAIPLPDGRVLRLLARSPAPAACS